MNKLRKLLVPILLMLALCAGCSKKSANSEIKTPQTVSSYQEDKTDLNVKSAIAFDLKNGQIFYAKNAKQKLPVASMSKLITIYLTLQAIKDGKLSWDEKVTADKDIANVAKNPDFANVSIKQGRSYTIRELYKATLIESANDAAMMLAKANAGNQQAFVIKMRELLKSWNIKGAQIYTPDGLPNYSLGSQAFSTSRSAENELSANDMGILITHLLKDFPQVIEITKIARTTFNNKIEMENWNWMLPSLSQYDSRFPVDGLKTGTTDAAGACFAGTMIKNGRRIVTVVMGAPHKDGSDPTRFTETKKLLSYIFNNYQLYILKKNQPIAGVRAVKVDGGKVKTIRPVLQKDTGVWLRNDQKIKGQFNKSFIAAPLKKRVNIGTILDTSIPALNENNCLTLPASAPENVQQANLFERIFN